MTSIPAYMTAKHRECDDAFTVAEAEVAAGNWPLAAKQWQLFKDELMTHFGQEEDILFPAFEHATGMTAGPTQVMRMEHQQMRALIHDLDQAMSSKDKGAYLGFAETLMVMMQQHNMKEEMMLYPMMAQNIAQGDDLVKSFEG